MIKNTIILSYGCPRTGTTFVNHMLGQGLDIITGKIAEGHASHPIKSNHGLLNLSYTFQKYNLVFVRTIRDPINIFESFYHAKSMKIEGLDNQDYSSIKKLIETEEINTKNQSKEGINIVTINFDKLGETDYAKEKIHDIICNTKDSVKNIEIYLEFIKNKYNKNPIRQGRLSDNLRKVSYLSEDQKQDINQWYEKLLNQL